MTAVDEPQARPGVPARAWRAFRTWQHGRPFWGGLVTIIAGIEYYLSVHLNPTSVSVSFGQQGFVAWLLPLGLLLCGALAWVSPAQRLFYGILATAASVYGLIGLNLGGFFLGMLIGIVGGSLITSWTPRTNQSGAGDTVPGDDGSTEGEPAEPEESAGLDVVTDTAELPGGAVPSGPLSDELPSATSQAELVRAARHAAPDESGAQRRRLWRHGGRGTTLIVVPVALAAVALVAGGRGTPAFAAPTPCPTTTAPKTTKPTTPAPAPTTPAAPAPTTPAAPSPTPSATTDSAGNPVGDLINGIVDGIGNLLGIGGDSTPTPTPTPTQSVSPAGTPAQAAAAPTAVKPTTAKPTRTKSSSCSTPSPSASASAAPLNATVLAAPDGQPPVASAVATLTTDKLVMTNLLYVGVVDLPKKGGGTVQALKFTMDSAVQTPFKLDIPVSDGKDIVQKSSQLTISGHVEFYCTSFSGMIELAGVIIPLPLTFTPDGLIKPPNLGLETTIFHAVTIKLAYVHADGIVANDFRNASA